MPIVYQPRRRAPLWLASALWMSPWLALCLLPSPVLRAVLHVGSFIPAIFLSLWYYRGTYAVLNGVLINLAREQLIPLRGTTVKREGKALLLRWEDVGFARRERIAYSQELLALIESQRASSPEHPEWPATRHEAEQQVWGGTATPPFWWSIVVFGVIFGALILLPVLSLPFDRLPPAMIVLEAVTILLVVPTLLSWVSGSFRRRFYLLEPSAFWILPEKGDAVRLDRREIQSISFTFVRGGVVVRFETYHPRYRRLHATITGGGNASRSALVSLAQEIQGRREHR